MLSKKSPVKLLPSIAGMLDGANHPINPNPITFRSVRSQFLSKLPQIYNTTQQKVNHHRHQEKPTVLISN
jgi:hypothetical protein